jgi:hypothetical protein
MSSKGSARPDQRNPGAESAKIVASDLIVGMGDGGDDAAGIAVGAVDVRTRATASPLVTRLPQKWKQSPLPRKE